MLNKVFFLSLLVLLSCSSHGPEKRMHKCPNKPNCVFSLQNDEHFIAPLQKDNLDQIRVYLKAQENVKIIIDEDDYLHAVFTSSFFRFKDDVEFQRKNEFIHVRSASRTGYFDMGVNRKRIETIRENLRAN